MTAQKRIIMRRFFLLTLAASFLMVATWTLAEEQKTTDKSATPSASSVVNEKKVQQLKEKLATQVAQLRENQKKGFYGEVSTLSKTSFTLLADTGEVKIRFTDDTIFFKAGKTKSTAKVEDLKNGVFISALGLFDEESKQHNAKVIFIESKIKYIAGEVTQINKDEAKITVKSASDSFVVDYEKSTTADEFTPSTKKVGKSGLSRLSTGDKIQVWGTPAEEDAKAISAARILRFPKELFGSSEVKGEVKESSASASTSASPKASPKATPKTATASASVKPAAKASPKASPSASPKT